jgi:hemolysin III
LLSAVWELALCGILLKLFWMEAPNRLSVVLCLAMGWLALVAASAIFRAGGMAWILAGGLVFRVGPLIYGFKHPDPLPGYSVSTSYGTISSWRVAPATSG